ncbi:hypothetical protein BP6252_11247 [Coleophoma cylindrospora]|uniref:AB hydrolase-1 domain-containing protein n=1 Tax=Coleophoma cylindrospora TaxID=1849047 RepID=A0A3D8QPI4_9HELO|nr:hypothetical protein BP6252_11247 [Coleophoma cylindrospora]
MASAIAIYGTPLAPDYSFYMTGFRNPSKTLSVGGAAVCIQGDVLVKAAAMNIHLNYTEPADQIVVTNTILEYYAVNSTLVQQVEGGKQNVSGTWKINAKLCFPASTNGTNSTTVQILTHGVGFEKSYWDFYSSKYSYVEAAALAGYTTFSYDRLGTGLSDHPDPIQVVQTPLEMSILHELIQMLRSGRIGSIPFSHVVGVGHSFGSGLTASNTVNYPSDLDAAVLTGFSVDSSGKQAFWAGLNLEIAAYNTPARFDQLPRGYLVPSTVTSTQFGFFRAPDFDPLVLMASNAGKQTFTIGELFTNNLLAGLVATNFTGPVDIVDGEHDLDFCDGNCLLPTNKVAAVRAAVYPKSSNASEWYVAPGAGHGTNLHYSAPAMYQQMLNFIASNGL